MSGGSYDYAFGKVVDMADSLSEVKSRNTPLRRAFAKHLRLVAEAMHDIEWVDSGDCGLGDEVAAIEAVLGKDVQVLELAEAIADAETANTSLQNVLAKAKEFMK